MHDDPLRPHSHDNNIIIPGDDESVTLALPDGRERTFSAEDLASFPQHEINYSYTTDHGPHGPYRLGGVALADLVSAEMPPDTPFNSVEVISADGFGNRVDADELSAEGDPILLCITCDSADLSRQLGLVRLVVPSETDNALRQIKWVKQIRIR